MQDNNFYGGTNIINVGDRYVFDKVVNGIATLNPTEDGVYIGRTVLDTSTSTIYIKIVNEDGEQYYKPLLNLDSIKTALTDTDFIVSEDAINVNDGKFIIYHNEDLVAGSKLPDYNFFIAVENIPIQESSGDASAIANSDEQKINNKSSLNKDFKLCMIFKNYEKVKVNGQEKEELTSYLVDLRDYSIWKIFLDTSDGITHKEKQVEFSMEDLEDKLNSIDQWYNDNGVLLDGIINSLETQSTKIESLKDDAQTAINSIISNKIDEINGEILVDALEAKEKYPSVLGLKNYAVRDLGEIVSEEELLSLSSELEGSKIYTFSRSFDGYKMPCLLVFFDYQYFILDLLTGKIMQREYNEFGWIDDEWQKINTRSNENFTSDFKKWIEDFGDYVSGIKGPSITGDTIGQAISYAQDGVGYAKSQIPILSSEVNILYTNLDNLNAELNSINEHKLNSMTEGMYYDPELSKYYAGAEMVAKQTFPFRIINNSLQLAMFFSWIQFMAVQEKITSTKFRRGFAFHTGDYVTGAYIYCIEDGVLYKGEGFNDGAYSSWIPVKTLSDVNFTQEIKDWIGESIESFDEKTIPEILLKLKEQAEQTEADLEGIKEKNEIMEDNFTELQTIVQTIDDNKVNNEQIANKITDFNDNSESDNKIPNIDITKKYIAQKLTGLESNINTNANNIQNITNSTTLKSFSAVEDRIQTVENKIGELPEGFTSIRNYIDNKSTIPIINTFFDLYNYMRNSRPDDQLHGTMLTIIEELFGSEGPRYSFLYFKIIVEDGQQYFDVSIFNIGDRCIYHSICDIKTGGYSPWESYFLGHTSDVENQIVQLELETIVPLQEQVANLQEQVNKLTNGQ